MTAKQLTDSILQLAIQGKLVPQDPNDEPASVLLDRIKEEKKRLVKEGKLKKKDLVETPISEDEIPFEIPESWEWVRLGGLCAVKGGKRIPVGENFSESPTNHIYIRVTDMKNHTLVKQSLKYISDKLYEKLKQYTISKDDLYLTIAGTIGDVGDVPEDFDGMNLTENAVKLAYLQAYKYYLMYAILSPLVQSQFVDKTKQMAQPKLAIERIKTTMIPLPPINEQHRIVEKLDGLKSLFNEYGSANDELTKLNTELPEKLKKSILQEAIMGKLGTQDPNDEPASVLLDRIREEKKQLVKEGVLKKKDLFENPISENDKPFEIPCKWAWSRMSTLCSLITKGTTPRGGNVAYLDKGIGFLRAENVFGIDQISKINMKYIDQETNDGFLKRSILQENDVLITIAGTLGRTAIVRKEDLPLNANQAISLCRFIDTSMVNLKYIVYALNAPDIQRMMMSFKKITAIPNLTLEIISDTIIPLPPLAEQHRIVEKIEALFAEIDHIEI